MKILKTNTIEIKKSKFIAYLYDIENIGEIKVILDNLRTEHKKASMLFMLINLVLLQVKVMIKNQVALQELRFIIYLK